MAAVVPAHAVTGQTTGSTRPVRAARPTDANVVTRLDRRTLTPAQVASVVQRAMAAHHVTGLSVAVINRADIVYHATFGYRDAASKTPLTESTVMDGGTFAQAMIGYMVMQLVDKHILALDTPVSTYMDQALAGEYKAVAQDERYKRITIRMLLDHTSGLSNVPPLGRDSLVTIQFDPGTRYQYSNAGLNLLGLVVTHVTKRSLDDLLHERVFKPFGMTHTSLVWTNALGATVATGYDAQGHAIPLAKHTVAHVAGPVYTTPSDLTRFVLGVLGDAHLSPQARAEMFKPQIRVRSMSQFSTSPTEATTRDNKIRLSRALGWGVLWSPYGPTFFADGRDDGWSAYTVAFDDAKTAVVFISNSVNAEKIFPELLDTLIGDSYTPSAWLGYGPTATVTR